MPAGPSVADDGRYDRQVLAFGRETQRRLGRLRVAVVGAGGAGSLLVQGLAHLGVGGLVVVDPDVVEESNLSRVVGATPADAARAVPKVEVARRHALSINPAAEVVAVRGDVLDPAVWLRLRGVDAVVGAVDGHAPRWALNRFAVQYQVLYLDVGVELARLGSAPSSGLEVGGRVAVVRPGGACLACQGGYDPVLAAREQDALTAAARAAAGYVTAPRAVSTADPAADPAADPRADLPADPGAGPAASVLFLNQVAAGLALAELVNSVCPWRPSGQQVLFDLIRPALVDLHADVDPGCAVCGPGGVRAAGDSGGVPPRPARYASQQKHNSTARPGLNRPHR